jgi:hypothetical protein
MTDQRATRGCSAAAKLRSSATSLIFALRHNSTGLCHTAAVVLRPRFHVRMTTS